MDIITHVHVAVFLNPVCVRSSFLVDGWILNIFTAHMCVFAHHLSEGCVVCLAATGSHWCAGLNAARFDIPWSLTVLWISVGKLCQHRLLLVSTHSSWSWKINLAAWELCRKRHYASGETSVLGQCVGRCLQWVWAVCICSPPHSRVIVKLFEIIIVMLLEKLTW